MTSQALRRQAFTTHDQYLEAAYDLAEQNRQALARLFSEEGDPEAKCVLASNLLKSWGEDHDGLWGRRVTEAQRQQVAEGDARRQLGMIRGGDR